MKPCSKKEQHIFPVFSVNFHWMSLPRLMPVSGVDLSSNKGVRVSQVKPSDCFMRLKKLVLPSIVDTSLSSLMTWNLQSFERDIFTGGESKHTVTPARYFQGVKIPSKPVVYAPDALNKLWVKSSSLCHSTAILKQLTTPDDVNMLPCETERDKILVENGSCLRCKSVKHRRVKMKHSKFLAPHPQWSFCLKLIFYPVVIMVANVQIWRQHCTR